MMVAPNISEIKSKFAEVIPLELQTPKCNSEKIKEFDSNGDNLTSITIPQINTENFESDQISKSSPLKEASRAVTVLEASDCTKDASYSEHSTFFSTTTSEVSTNLEASKTDDLNASDPITVEASNMKFSESTNKGKKDANAWIKAIRKFIFDDELSQETSIANSSNAETSNLDTSNVEPFNVHSSRASLDFIDSNTDLADLVDNDIFDAQRILDDLGK